MDNNELKHYGVLGMKWGIRKDKRDSRTHKKEKPTEESDSKLTLTDKQKKAIKIGAAVVGTALLTYGAYKLNESKVLEDFIIKGKSSLIVGDNDVFKKINKAENISEALSKVNNTGSRNNCYNCVVATVGRLCGLNMSAKGDTTGGKGLSFEQVTKVFNLKDDDIRYMNNPNTDKLLSYLTNKYSEGDVGALAVGFNDKYKNLVGIQVTEKAAHTLNWIKKDGQIELLDGQINKRGDFIKTFLTEYLDNNTEVSIAKLANINTGINLDSDVNLELLKSFVD